jgi:hypothetical protein
LITAFFSLSRHLNAQNEMRVYLPTPCSFSTSITDDHSSSNDFLLYPNPGNGIINIEFSRITESPTKLKLLNMQGLIVYKDIIQENTLYHELNVSNLQSGIYILQIGNSGVSKRKIVVLH